MRGLPTKGHLPTFERWGRHAGDFSRRVLALGRWAVGRCRFSMRAVLIGVALVATALAYHVLRQRAESYQTTAETWARSEAINIGLVGRYEAKDPEWDWVIRQMAAYCAAMRKKYEWAASHPWLAVHHDPPYPWKAVMERRMVEALERRIGGLPEGDPYADHLRREIRRFDSRMR